MQSARSIRTAMELLSRPREKTVIVTELALVDGNWRDLVQRVRSVDTASPIVLMTCSSTAELWWDALECGIDDIVRNCLIASRVSQLLSENSSAERNQ